MSIRPVKKLIKAKPTLEGAGVHLRRAFGFGNTSDFDPFLLLDDFRNERPEDYLAGFPWHPHRGIETITYVLAGTVEHGDSMGNRGAIAAGDVQWMTAGSGIIHQEMPKGDADGRMHGFQFWANLPAALKMTPPRYQESQVRRDSGGDGRRRDRGAAGVRQLLGEAGPRGGDRRGPGLHRRLGPAGERGRRSPWRRRAKPSPTSSRARGSSATRRDRSRCRRRRRVGRTPRRPPQADNRSLVLFDRGDEVTVQAGDEGIRFLLVSGRPLQEPVAWYGPIVMNTQEQLRRAFEQLEDGTFLKSQARK